MGVDGDDNDFDNYVDSVAGIEPVTPVVTGGNDGDQGSSNQSPVNNDTQGNDQDTQGQPNNGVDTQAEGSDQQPNQDGKVSQKPQLERHAAGGFVNKSTGDIVDESGRILAKAGSARRLYEERGRLTHQNTQLTEQLTNTRKELQAVQFLNGIPQQHGMTPQEVAEGLDIVARIKKGDVVGVTKDLVAKMVAKGHNVSELLGKEVGDSVDMRAIRLMIDEGIKPIRQQTEQQEQLTQAQQTALTNYQNFVSEHEYADTHGDDIVRLVQGQGLSHTKAYYALREYAIRNQLDFTKPLRPQIEARSSQQVEQQPQQFERPLPNAGARTRPNGVQQPAQQFADADDDWASIIRSTMAAN